MSQSVILFGKSITLFLWILIVFAAMGRIDDPFRWMLLGFGAIVLFAHVLEVSFLLLKHRDRVRSPADIVSVLIFGLFSLKPLLDDR